MCSRHQTPITDLGARRPVAGVPEEMLETDRDIDTPHSRERGARRRDPCCAFLRDDLVRAFDAPAGGCVQHRSAAWTGDDGSAAGTGFAARPACRTACAYSGAGKCAKVTALVTGASGYIGSRLVRELLELGEPVAAVVREPNRVTFDPAVTVYRADMLDRDSLRAIDCDCSTAYYLVHSMGRGGNSDYEQRDVTAASNFARFAKAAGIDRVIYLGGLGDRPGSKHLRSRQRVGEVLRAEGPPLTWFRAGMVVGAGSESYRTLRSLVERLPVMLAPAWLSTPTQAIGIDDVLRYLTEAPRIAETRSREIQIGSAEILTYGQMLDAMSDALGLRRRPRIPVPLLTPWLSSHWIGLVTPVDTGVARPLIEGLSTETTVTDRSGMALFDFAPRSFEHALRAAIAEAGESPSDQPTPSNRQPAERDHPRPLATPAS